MKYIFSFLVLFISLTIFSQRHLIGGKIGPTMENDLTITGEPRIGVILGATYDYQITPTLRVEFKILNNPTMRLNGSKVLPDFGMPGKGAEFMTTDPVKVRLINWQPLR